MTKPPVLHDGPREVTRTDLPALRPPAHPAARSAPAPVDPSDLAINALHHSQDRAALMRDETRLLEVLRKFEQLERTVDDQDLEITLLRQQLAAAKAEAGADLQHARKAAADESEYLRKQLAAAAAERDTFKRAYEKETTAALGHANEVVRLQQLNAQRSSELDTARRLNLLLTEQHHGVLAELLQRDETDRLNDQVRSTVPPADRNAFEDAPACITRVRFPTGTNPENETVVVNVPLPRGQQ